MRVDGAEVLFLQKVSDADFHNNTHPTLAVFVTAPMHDEELTTTCTVLFILSWGAPSDLVSLPPTLPARLSGAGSHHQAL